MLMILSRALFAATTVMAGIALFRNRGVTPRTGKQFDSTPMTANAGHA